MTKMPQLDPYLKTEVSTEVSAAKAADKELSRIQTFMLDGMARSSNSCPGSSIKEGAFIRSGDPTLALELMGSTCLRIQ